jgi:hypothetical protein
VVSRVLLFRRQNFVAAYDRIGRGGYAYSDTVMPRDVRYRYPDVAGGRADE